MDTSTERREGSCFNALEMKIEQWIIFFLFISFVLSGLVGGGKRGTHGMVWRKA